MLKFDIFGICLIWFFLFSLLKYNFFCRSEASSTGCRLCLPSFLSLGLRSLPFPVMGTLLRLVYASSKLSSPRSVSSASFVIDRCLFSSPLKYECVLWRYYFSFFFLPISFWRGRVCSVVVWRSGASCQRQIQQQQQHLATGNIAAVVAVLCLCCH